MSAASAALSLLYVALISETSQATAPPPAYIRAPSSFRRIPRQAIEDKLGDKTLPINDLSNRVYEIESGVFLAGFDLALDLRHFTPPSDAAGRLASARVLVNGDEPESSAWKSVLRDRAGNSAVFGKDGTLTALWNDNVFLEPLHVVRYPGIFVNTQQQFLDTDEADEDATEPTMPEPRRAIRNFSKRIPQKLRIPCHEMKVAIAFDNVFCARFGNSSAAAAAFVEKVVQFANRTFERDTCHQIRLAILDGHCEDPFDPYDYRDEIRFIARDDRSDYISERFRLFWLANRSATLRDAAYLFTGYRDGSSTAGIAYLGAACSRHAFGWVEAGQRPIFTHEVGHTLGARHTSNGIMRAIGGRNKFSTVSVIQINRYLKSSARCIKLVAS